MSYLLGLRCRECGTTFPAEALFVCENCFGPLEAYYDETARNGSVTREQIQAGPRTLWRYQPFLPSQYDPRTDLNDGFTPLVKANNLGRALGLKNLYLKNDTVNPSFSFKDRVVSVAAAKALEFGMTALACASTGNLAGAVAAHAARAGMDSFVFIPADLEPGKIISAAIYGATIVAVHGDYDQANRLATEAAEVYGWGFVNINLRPYYAEGSKTLAFEVAEQLGWRAPDRVVVPIASGALFTKIRKGFEELWDSGLIDGPLPKMVGAQAQGCAPVANAFRAGEKEITPVKARSIAKSLAIGNPADGRYALDVARRSGGGIYSTPEASVAEGMALLARTEGIFGETAAGVTISVLKQLADSGALDPEETIVAYITGNGLKTREVVEPLGHARIDTEPNLESFQVAFDPPVFALPARLKQAYSTSARPVGSRRPDRSIPARRLRLRRVSEDKMSCRVKIPTPLRRHTNGQSTVEVSGASVRTALDGLLTQYPTIGERLFDGQGQVKPHLNIFLNNEDIRFLNGLETPLKDGDTVVLLPALAGGQIPI